MAGWSENLLHFQVSEQKSLFIGEHTCAGNNNDNNSNNDGKSKQPRKQYGGTDSRFFHPSEKRARGTEKRRDAETCSNFSVVVVRMWWLLFICRWRAVCSLLFCNTSYFHCSRSARRPSRADFTFCLCPLALDEYRLTWTRKSPEKAIKWTFLTFDRVFAWNFSWPLISWLAKIGNHFRLLKWSFKCSWQVQCGEEI